MNNAPKLLENIERVTGKIKESVKLMQTKVKEQVVVLEGKMQDFIKRVGEQKINKKVINEIEEYIGKYIEEFREKKKKIRKWNE